MYNSQIDFKLYLDNTPHSITLGVKNNTSYFYFTSIEQLVIIFREHSRSAEASWAFNIHHPPSRSTKNQGWSNVARGTMRVARSFNLSAWFVTITRARSPFVITRARDERNENTQKNQVEFALRYTPGREEVQMMIEHDRSEDT